MAFKNTPIHTTKQKDEIADVSKFNNIPIYISEYTNEIAAVSEYDQKRLERFLIINLNREQYDSLNILEASEKLFNQNGEVYLLYDKKAYNDNTKHISQTLIKQGRADLLETIKDEYNPEVGTLDVKEQQKPQAPQKAKTRRKP